MLKSEVANRRAGNRCTGLLVLTLLFGSAFLTEVPAVAQAHDPGDRKLITRVEPEYPDALKKLYIGGVVRVEVLVAPSGAVKSTTLIGGSPILGQSTMKAIKQWRYAPAAADESLTVKIEFDPHR